MKQQDIALLIIVIFLSAMTSMFVGKAIIKPPKGQAAKVEVVEAINTSFDQPDSTIFNDSAINPTRLIEIGKDQNQQPIMPQN